MTPNTIAYANLVEDKRHNIVSEKQNEENIKYNFSLGKESNAIAARNARSNERNAATNARNALTNLFNAQSNAQKWISELEQTKVRDQQTYLTNAERNRIQAYAANVTKYLGELDYEVKKERSHWEEKVAKRNADANEQNAETNRRNASTNAFNALTTRDRQKREARELDWRQRFDAVMAEISALQWGQTYDQNKKNATWGNVNNSIKSIGSLISGIGGIFGKGKGSR